jgi:hypothetical protein
VPNNDPLTICLMGDTKFGKTSLIASLQGCIDQAALGYKPDRAFGLRVVGQTYLSPDQYAMGTYKAIENRLFGVGDGTSVEKTFDYDFEITGSLGDRDAAEPFVLPIKIHDTGGAVWMSSVEQFTGDRPVFLDNFNEYRDRVLPKASAIVLVIPLFESWEVRNDVPWRERLGGLLEAIMTQPGFDKIRRIAVVFTHYERLFVDFGAMAARIATEPDVAKEVIREALRRMHRQQLAARLLTRNTGNRKILFMPVSAHGFVRGNGCPNFDPATNLLLHRTLGEAQDMGRRALWRPFCTADPFLFAATGARSDYMFSYEELFDEEPVDPHHLNPDGGQAHEEHKEHASKSVFGKLVEWVLRL